MNGSNRSESNDMKGWFSIGCVVLVAIGGCTSAVEDTPPMDLIEQRDFLLTIGRRDQYIRTAPEWDDFQYPPGSPEQHRLFWAERAVDSTNAFLIREYLLEYGSPHPDSLGDDAANVPWVVLHHSQSDWGLRRQFVDTLRHAYERGVFDRGPWALFLKRMDEHENGEFLVLEGTYRAEDELRELYRRLGLAEYQAPVESR